MYCNSHQGLRAALLAAMMAVGLPAFAGNPIKRVEPVYPADAARAGITGYVELEYSVGPDGKVTDVSVVDAKLHKFKHLWHSFEAGGAPCKCTMPGTESGGSIE